MAGSNVTPERSLVTVLVADTVDSTGHIADCDPDDAQEFLDLIFDRIRSAIEAAGGHLVSFAGDGGIAVFGWPNSLEEHADRACEAAWRIVNPGCEKGALVGPDGIPAQFRIGIHSGLVGLRQISLEIGSRLDTVGGTVHLAAALEKRSPPNGILISSTSLELCRSVLDVKPSDDIQALAKINAGVFLLRGPPGSGAAKQPAVRYEGRLVGRADELAALLDAMPNGRKNCAAIALVGEPGIGKSRLAFAAVEKIDRNEVRLLAFSGDLRMRTTAFAVMRALINELLQFDGAEFGPPQTDRLMKFGIPTADIEVLASVLAAGRSQKRKSGNLFTQTQLSRILVETLLAATAGKPTLMLVEDLHWIDPESCECLALLTANYDPAHLTLILTARPEMKSFAVRIAKTILHLDPLSRENMIQLARTMMDEAELPNSVVDRAVERAEGIPFVLEQILYSVDPLKPDSFDPLPLSVQSLINARMNKLSAHAKYLVQSLSVVGEYIEIDIARDILNGDAKSLSYGLSELSDMAFIHPPGGSSIRFRHAIIAESCLTTVPGQRRREIHNSVIETITAKHQDLSGYHERLAFHAEEAGDLETALEYLWQAGLTARRKSAGASLQLIFDRAMTCVDRLGKSGEGKLVDFVLMVCAPLLQLGEFDKMNQYLPRALELALSQNRRDKVCTAMCHMALVCWFEGRYEEGVPTGERALELALEQQQLPQIFAAQFALANLLHGMGQMESAIALIKELCDLVAGDLESARLGSIANPSSMAWGFHGWFLIEIGQYDESLRLLEKALAIARRQKDAYAEVLALSSRGSSFLMLRRNEDAERSLREALHITDRVGFATIKPNVVGRLSAALSRLGRADEAVQISEECFAAGLHKRTGQLEVFTLHAGYGEALFRAGSLEQGLGQVTGAIDIARRIKNPCLLVWGLGLRARLQSEAGVDDRLIRDDIKTRDALCRKYGLVAWPA